MGGVRTENYSRIVAVERPRDVPFGENIFSSIAPAVWPPRSS